MQPDAQTALFLSHLTVGLPPGGPVDVEALARCLREMLADARAAWPGIDLPEADFSQYLARRVPRDAALPGALLRLHAADLFLTCACATGRDEAAALLRQHHRPRMRATLLSLRLAPNLADDIEQSLWARLLTAAPGARPQIEGYAGTGPLRSWLCVAAVRQARRALERPREALLGEDALLELLGAERGSELGFLKERYRKEFRVAFSAALRTLAPRERNILRCHLDGHMTNAQIGALCGVHPGTVKRWMAAIRGTLLSETRRALSDQLNLGAAEVDSVIRLIQSDLDLSFDLMLSDAASGC